LAVYDINSGLRDREILNLRTTWKADVAGMSDVYVIPGYWTDEVTGEVFKVTKNGLPRVHIPNKICRSILSDCIKLMDPEAERPVIFTYRKQPITRVTNTGWKKARAKAGMKDPYLSDLHFHDLRHTFGHRLREAGVGGPDRDTLLGHVSGSLTDHYSQADIRHLKSCVEKITKRSNAIPVLSVASIFK
jgi:integrase